MPLYGAATRTGRGGAPVGSDFIQVNQLAVTVHLEFRWRGVAVSRAALLHTIPSASTAGHQTWHTVIELTGYRGLGLPMRGVPHWPMGMVAPIGPELRPVHVPAVPAVPGRVHGGAHAAAAYAAHAAPAHVPDDRQTDVSGAEEAGDQGEPPAMAPGHSGTPVPPPWHLQPPAVAVNAGHAPPPRAAPGSAPGGGSSRGRSRTPPAAQEDYAPGSASPGRTPGASQATVVGPRGVPRNDAMATQYYIA
jgi:hypothetical protein